MLEIMQIKKALLILILAIFSFSSCCIEEESGVPTEVPTPTPALTPQDTPLPTITPYSETSINFTAIGERVEEVRGLELKSEVPHRYIEKNELEERYNSTDDGDDRPDEILLKALFMVEEGDDLDQVEAAYKSSTIMAYYDIKEKEMVIVRGYEDELEKIYAHEYLHALQDQHFNLTAILNQSSFDQYMASKALVEGDARLFYDLYCGKTPSGITMGITRVYDDVTRRTLEEFRMFAQTKGKFFVTQLYTEGGGWEKVNDAYLNPPATCEMIMHPNKYSAGERGADMSVPETPLDGWQMTVEDTMGELFIRTMLDDYISSGNATIAAAGWGGDRLALYQNETDYLFIFNISWDSRKDADEFVEGYSEMMTALNRTDVIEERDPCRWVVDDGKAWITLVEFDDALNRTVIIGSSNQLALEEGMGVL
ncbi:MAG: conserved hypothetical protein, secreted [Candidatus Syntrophoarchaeum caldarius]|uniref:Uncharacterized protein n=1 Tax=Candidatus Syntropharchaeum caldarium TaxID=1838285 RepID=A0A1F2P7M8_9EURY|nr:MAG: conserved hypothetical protein, secreted [Candidatus Syntrophoarchaeum caldarius]